MKEEEMVNLLYKAHMAMISDKPIEASYILYDLLLELIVRVYKNDNSSVG